MEDIKKPTHAVLSQLAKPYIKFTVGLMLVARQVGHF